MKHLRSILFVLGLLLPAVSSAETAVLVHAAQSVGQETVQTELKARWANYDDLSIHLLNEWLGASLPSVFVDGSPDFVPCSDAAPMSVKEELSRGSERVDFLEYHEAIVVLDDLAANLPCQTEAIGRDQMARLFFLMGIGRFYMDDRNRARNEFRQSLSLDPSRRWNTDYPPDPYGVYIEAREDLTIADPAFFTIDVAEGELASIRLDGKELALGERHEVEVTPGYHLVQWSDDGTIFESRWWLLRSDEHFRIFGPNAVRESLRAAAIDPDLAQWAADMFRTTVNAETRTIVLDMSLETERGDAPGYIYDVQAGYSGPLETRTQYLARKEREELERDPTGSMRDRARVGLGWGVGGITSGYAGVEGARAGYLYADLALDVQVRMVESFGMGLGVNGMIRSDTIDGRTRNVILPSLHLYPFLRLARGFAQPSIGLGPVIAFDAPGDLPPEAEQPDVGRVLIAPGVAMNLHVDFLLRSPTGPILRIGGRGGVMSLRVLQPDTGRLDDPRVLPFGAVFIGVGIRL